MHLLAKVKRSFLFYPKLVPAECNLKKATKQISGFLNSTNDEIFQRVKVPSLDFGIQYYDISKHLQLTLEIWCNVLKRVTMDFEPNGNLPNDLSKQLEIVDATDNINESVISTVKYFKRHFRRSGIGFVANITKLRINQEARLLKKSSSKSSMLNKSKQELERSRECIAAYLTQQQTSSNIIQSNSRTMWVQSVNMFPEAVEVLEGKRDFSLPANFEIPIIMMDW